MACFNPRVRAGRDQYELALIAGTFVSIHASARDATSSFFVMSRARQFQSTRPRGTRHLTDLENAVKTAVSIHASARDATQP